MKLNLRRAISSVSMLAIAGGVLAATASMANAATTPPWEPDPNALGTLTFYNSAGQVVTGGSDLTHLFDFVQASSADTFGGTKAEIGFAQPVPSTPTGNFPASALSASSTFPNASAPAPLNTSTLPVASLGATDGNLANFIASVTAQTATGFTNVFQIRLFTTGPGGVGTINNGGGYWDADVVVNPSAGTWSVEYPATVSATTTTLTANPSPALTTDSVTLTATEAPATAGSVDFKDGATDLGSAAVNGSGVATLSHTFATAGSQSLTATFTPTDTADFNGSTGNATLVVNVPSTPTTTSLTVNQNGFSGSDVSLSSTVLAGATPVTAGTVSWFDNGSTTPLNATPVTPSAAGVATFDIPAGLAQGGHSIVAKFSPTDVTQFEASQSAPQPFFLNPPQQSGSPCSQPGSNCTDVQNIQATIPVGTLVLTTPYTASSPLDLGNLALNTGLTGYIGSAAFNNIVVVDTRAGDLPWTLAALASNLSDGGANPGSLICGQNVGLTALVSTPGAGFAGTVTTTDNDPASPPVAPSGGACTGTQGLGGSTPHTVATATAGLGTDTLNGTLTLTAPTSTEPGLFKGTITFTVG
jgi:Bacterial Ig-like domain (group 3)